MKKFEKKPILTDFNLTLIMSWQNLFFKHFFRRYKINDFNDSVTKKTVKKYVGLKVFYPENKHVKITNYPGILTNNKICNFCEF